MLAGMPLLKELDCQGDISLTGNINSLRELKDALEKVNIRHCGNIRGNIMDLADFPRLKELDFHFTAVMGDIRDIREHGFEALESLSLPRSVHGGTSYEFQLISDVPEFMHTIHLLLQRTPTLFKEQSLSKGFYWALSDDSPDSYDWDDWESPPPPFCLQFIQAGSRRGWSWCTGDEDEPHSCEINWLDPEPSSEGSDYETYTEELQRIERRVDFYRGCYQPPTEEEYRRLCEISGLPLRLLL
jgi:hypothetical protein